MTGTHFMESVVHMELLRYPVKILRRTHHKLLHGVFAAVVVHQLFTLWRPCGVSAFRWCFAARTTLPRAAASTFPVRLCRLDRKGNCFLVYFFLHKTSFPSGLPVDGRPPYTPGQQKTSGQCGPEAYRSAPCCRRLSFPAPSGLFRPVPAWSAR